MSLGDMPAYPICNDSGITSAAQSAVGEDLCYGLSIRQHAAIEAMKGLLSSLDKDEILNEKLLCKTAVSCADALIAELEK